MNFNKNWNPYINWLIGKPKRTCYLVFILCLLVSLFVINLRFQVSYKNHQQEMSNTLTAIQKNIEHALKTSYTSILTVAMTVNHHGEVEDFEKVAARVMESNPNLDAVQLVPDGIIRYIYPLEGNEVVMGYNILGNHSPLDETYKAITINNMYFAGPFELKQGGIGIIGRYPIYKNHVFWGFSAVVIRFEKLMEIAGIGTIDASKYYVQFGKIHPDTNKEVLFMPNKADFSDKHYESVTFPESNWNLHLICKNDYHLLTALIPHILFALLMSFIIPLVIWVLLKKPSELLLLAKSQEKKIQKSEAHYQTIFNQAHIGIVQIDCFTEKFIEANNQYCKLLGYSNAELREMKYHEITHPDDLNDCISMVDQLKSGQTSNFIVEKRYIAKNNNTVWVNLSASPFWTENEKHTTIIAIVEDITARKKAERKIRKSEMQFKSLFNDSPIALWEQDLSAVKAHIETLGLTKKTRKEVAQFFTENPDAIIDCIRLIKVLKVNKECLNLHEVESQEELMQNFIPILEKGSLIALQKILVGISQYEKRGESETKIVTSKGKKRNIALVWNVVRGFEKSYERVIISTEDITERKESEQVIIASQQRTESLINTIDGIVWECDAKTFHFTFISKKVEYILGYTPEEWLRSPNFWAEHIHPDDREWTLGYCQAQTIENKQHDFEYRMIAKDGRIVWLRDIVNVVTEADGNKSLRGIMIDITKSKDAEIDLNNSFVLVSEQNKRLLNFSYIVSHNLRSHTSNIQSLSILINGAESENERQQLIPMLTSVSDALNETMHNLNEIVNIQANININTNQLNLMEYINKTLKLLAETIRQKKVAVVCEVDDTITIDYNPAYMESILVNLVSNSVRYSDPQKASVVRIRSYNEDQKTVLEITDNGIGIDLERNRQKLFGMYRTFSNNVDARGMGLFITKNQVDAMGGTITVESQLGKGTTFKIYFK